MEDPAINEPVERTAVLLHLAERIAELEQLGSSFPDAALAEDLNRIAGLLRAVLILISEVPEAFDKTAPWWTTWLREKGGINRRSRGPTP